MSRQKKSKLTWLEKKAIKLDKRMTRIEKSLLKHQTGQRLTQVVYFNFERDRWIERGWQVDFFQPSAFGAPQSYQMSIDREICQAYLEPNK